MKKLLLFFVKISVSVGLMTWLVQRVDWGVVGRHLSGVSVSLIFLYMILLLIGTVISARKWQIISGFKELHFTVREGFFTYLTGSFINNFLPSTIGGDAYRSVWLAKRSGAKAASFSTVVFDRFIGLWTTAVLALFFSAFLWRYFFENIALAVTLSCLIVFLFVDMVITYAYCSAWFIKLIERIPFQKVRRLFEEVIFFTKKHIWFRTSLWSAFFVFVGVGLANFLLFRALGSTIGLPDFLSVIFIIVIISSIPISINNIGIKEWAYVTFFGLVGVSAELAVTAALLSRFLQMLISFIALPQYWRTREE